MLNHPNIRKIKDEILRNMEINQILWKLAHFEPATTDDYGNQVLDYLVLDALSTYGPLLHASPEEIKEYIKELFLVDFEVVEIVTAASRLEIKDFAELIKPEDRWDNPQIKIKEEIYTKITNNIQAIRDAETEVFDTWKQELVKKYHFNPGVNKKIDEIIECFKIFLSSIFCRHGIECVNLLYPDTIKAQEWLENVKGAIINELPKIDELSDAILLIEIPNFFIKQDERRKR